MEGGERGWLVSSIVSANSVGGVRYIKNKRRLKLVTWWVAAGGLWFVVCGELLVARIVLPRIYTAEDCLVLLEACWRSVTRDSVWWAP